MPWAGPSRGRAWVGDRLLQRGASLSSHFEGCAPLTIQSGDSDLTLTPGERPASAQVKCTCSAVGRKARSQPSLGPGRESLHSPG